MTKTFCIVGAGFSGAVLARALVSNENIRCVVIDERDHVGGNCHTKRDTKTNIMEHCYGPHIFHTDSKKVWQYVNQFGNFHPFINRIKAINSHGVFSLPINLHTINQFFEKTFSPTEAKAYLAEIREKNISNPKNFEEQALSMIGRELYEAFFLGYTKKQWGLDPTQIPASVMKRLPVRFDYNDNYYSSQYQGIPEEGYTAVIKRILDHPNIEVQLNQKAEREIINYFDHLFWTGTIDSFFSHQFGTLSYRTVYWEKQYFEGDYQGNALINYTDLSVPYTRIHEHKHFTPWEKHEKSIVFTEYSKLTEGSDTPYYPICTIEDKALFQKYKTLAESSNKISFLGRLGTYQYLDMDQVIAQSLNFSEEVLNAIKRKTPIPVFNQNFR